MRSRIDRKFRWVASRAFLKFKHIIERVVKSNEVDELLAKVPAMAAETNLNGRVIIVTGSTRGVGLAVARAFVGAGGKIVINGRSAKEVDLALQDIRQSGESVTGVCADISTENGARQLISETLNTFGRIDILVNNAGVSGPHDRKAWEISPSEWQEVISVNLTGAFLCSRLVADWMVRNQVKGRIINVSSGVAQAPVKGLTPYFVSKIGLEALTRSMAIDAGWEGLTVTAVELGSLQTNMTQKHFSWEEFQELPPPETAVPIFLHAATAPREHIHGRISAAWRFAADKEGETLLTGPLAMGERPPFPVLKIDHKEVKRTDPGVVALDRAENVQGMPSKVRTLLSHADLTFDLSRYPDEKYPTLRKTLSSRFKLPEDCFTFGNGSVELVERSIRTFAKTGEEVISNDPSWFMFDHFCNIFGVVNQKVEFSMIDGKFNHNLEKVADSIGVNTRLIYLVNPSNPLGCGISKDEFRRFLEIVPSHIPIVVDEAYVDFTTRADTLRTHEVVMETDRKVIGLRTFSKFYALAGLRIGYAFAAPDTIRIFNRLEPFFVLSKLSEAAAVTALEDEEHANRTLDNICRERKRIEKRLDAAGLSYVSSEIHFMLVECPGPEKKVYQKFEMEGIFLSKGLIMDRYILFPIALPEQNDKNLEILFSI